MEHPAVTVILPVLNEARFIEDTMNDLLSQDYPGRIEFLVADGGSTDGTREHLEQWAVQDERMRVIDNPRKRQAHGFNRAASVASGEILVRADGHSRYAKDYVSSSVRALQELGGAVGGRMSPEGRDRLSRAVAAAMRSPWTMGPGRFHHSHEREVVDTIYLGALRKKDFEDLGGIRPFPSGSSEDADFYYRWRQSGRKVFLDPGIVSTYMPRDSLRALWNQYWRYGLGKAEMLWANHNLPSWRPLAPTALVLGLLVFLIVGLWAGVWWPFGALAAAWGTVLLVVASASGEPLVLVVLLAGVMHLAYGLGAIIGLIRGPAPIRRM